MKIAVLILFLLIYECGAAQSTINSVRQRRNSQEISPSQLAHQLTAKYSKEHDKVWAIFRWITDNIDYRVMRVSRQPIASYSAAHEYDTSALLSLDERVAETVLKQRLAVCDGYARLFKTLCDYAGIRAEVITGYGRTEPGRYNKRFRSNHTWNAVMIDSKWHLLDVTWASGYITWNGGEFVRRFEPRYFLTDPREFIRDHYPDDMRWTLLDDHVDMAEFRHSPFRQRSYIKYRIESVKPSIGNIDVNLGDTLFFVLNSTDYGKDTLVSNDPFLEIDSFNTLNSVVVHPKSIQGNEIRYEYPVSVTSLKWLYLQYNGDLILRYRLTVRD